VRQGFASDGTLIAISIAQTAGRLFIQTLVDFIDAQSKKSPASRAQKTAAYTTGRKVSLVLRDLPARRSGSLRDEPHLAAG
jgi:hypothetical protein